MPYSTDRRKEFFKSDWSQVREAMAMANAVAYHTDYAAYDTDQVRDFSVKSARIMEMPTLIIDDDQAEIAALKRRIKEMEN